ncbi:MAG: hypothetical protein ACK6A8_16415, partial [Planctomycetota bacterium]
GKEHPKLAARELKKKSPPRPVYAAATFEQEHPISLSANKSVPRGGHRGAERQRPFTQRPFTLSLRDGERSMVRGAW